MANVVRARVEVVSLSAVPTFGYETPTCYARNFWRNRAIDVLGLSGRDETTFSQQESREVERMTLHQVGMVTVCKIESYLPVVGTVIGAARLYGMATAQRHAEGEVDNRALAVFRGVVETLSLGSLLIIPDAITTYARLHWAQAQRVAAAHPATPPA